MSGFAALMALSASQTKESQSAVQMALAQRQRKEVARRKQQEEEEHKQRELDLKLRLKHFEDQKKAQERHMRLEQEEQARDALLRRRAEEQRDALRYGPKKAKSVATHSGDSSPRWPASASQAATREEVRKRRLPSDDDEPSPGSSATVLTREEKRERKLQAELRRASRPTKRAKVIRGYTKAGKQLPGGAIDVMTESAQVESGSTPQSVKARIAAMPNTLTKLNVVKRDTRTIDEIMQDRAKAREAKVLDGDEAREFSDWFGKGKKEAAKRMVQHATSAETSGANTPVPHSSSPSTYMTFWIHTCMPIFSCSHAQLQSAPKDAQNIATGNNVSNIPYENKDLFSSREVKPFGYCHPRIVLHETFYIFIYLQTQTICHCPQ